MKNHFRKVRRITGMMVILIAGFAFLVCAQTPKDPSYVPDIVDKPIIMNNTVHEKYNYPASEKMPIFPGGEKALLKYIQNNLQYPEDARKSHLEGKVIVRFTITKDGKLKNVKVVRGISTSLDKEALRIVNSLPDWTPGEECYSSPDRTWKKVEVIYTLPVAFHL